MSMKKHYRFKITKGSNNRSFSVNNQKCVIYLQHERGSAECWSVSGATVNLNRSLFHRRSARRQTNRLSPQRGLLCTCQRSYPKTASLHTLESAQRSQCGRSKSNSKKTHCSLKILTVRYKIPKWVYNDTKGNTDKAFL